MCCDSQTLAIGFDMTEAQLQCCRNRRCWYFYFAVSWWSRSWFVRPLSLPPIFNIGQRLTSTVCRQSWSPWQTDTWNMLINILSFLLSKPGTNPTWKWLRCKTGDVCHKFCFYCRSAGIVFFCRLKWQRAGVFFAHRFPNLCFLPLQDICEDISDHVEQIHALLETEFSLKLLSYSVNIIVDIRFVSFQHYRVRGGLKMQNAVQWFIHLRSEAA